MTNKINKLLITAWNAAVDAASAIMQVYKGNYQIDYKKDHSPVTIADKQADTIIQHYLNTTGISVISEESAMIPYEHRKDLNELWIVDPLDGTKEFIRHSTDFTVNIGLIKNNTPVLGVIIAPALNIGYWGTPLTGTFKTTNINSVSFVEDLIRHSYPIQCAVSLSNSLRITGTKSHMNRETELFFEKVKQLYPNSHIISVGSSLKFCKVAEGEADIYVRLSPINEWDTAAGDAIVRNAGGLCLSLNNNQNLTYNKPHLLQENFIACSKASISIIDTLLK
ncbi:MAG: 3'(2'),5'-bisphosphate nucleotidase CysQ [Flavobacteriales bacterium]|nr:3'(2'),5'-bisphosphate nucleotidase CysQ [Flavobacteriales bacterium]